MALPTNKGLAQPVSYDPDAWEWKRWVGELVGAFPRTRTFSTSLDPASVAANTVADQTFTITGLATTDIVVVNPPNLTAGLLVAQADVSAANTLRVRFNNTTGGAIDESSATWLILATRL